MIRHGKGPAPQEGDFYVDENAGVTYLRKGGSWCALNYHEVPPDVREKCRAMLIPLNDEFQVETDRPGIFEALGEMITGAGEAEEQK